MGYGNYVKFKDKPLVLDNGGVRFLKVVASIISLVPGIILGSAVKGLALATSSTLRDRYTRYPEKK